MPAEKLRKCKD